MTPEELLSPRWEVIASYPHSPFPVGQTIQQSDNWMGAQWYKETAPLYPHLFRPMGWWEGRKLSDLPKYVMAKTEVNILLMIKGWSSHHGDAIIHFTNGNHGYAKYYLPTNKPDNV